MPSVAYGKLYLCYGWALESFFELQQRRWLVFSSEVMGKKQSSGDFLSVYGRDVGALRNVTLFPRYETDRQIANTRVDVCLS